jgi:hypothetical protein
VKHLSVFVFIVSLSFLAACASKPVQKETPKAVPVPDAPFEKFSFRISASGIPSKDLPYDMWVMDTNRSMGVHTAKRMKDGKYKPINALAVIDPPDYDSLRDMIVKGKLYEIDSTDVTEVCPEAELYQLDIVPLAAMKPVRIAFSGCAKEYNLLVQPQREYLARLLDWFDRMRKKYRPDQPD